MYYPQGRQSRYSRRRLITLGIFLFSLLALSGLLYLFVLPSWQVRLSGTQTVAIAHQDGICEGDEDSGDDSSFAFQFVGPNNQTYRVADDSFCTNLISDGDRVTLWYMPNDPTRILPEPEAILLYVFSAIGGVADLALLIVSVLLLIVRRRQPNANMNAQTNYRYNRPYS